MPQKQIILWILSLFVAFYIGYDWHQKTAEVPTPVQTSTTITPSVEASRAPNKTAILYGEIESIHIKTSMASFRLVEWTTGSDNQEQAALESGACTLEQIERDECLSNPFFVRKTDKIISIPIANHATIQVQTPDKDGNMSLHETTLPELEKRLDQLKQTPFIFTTTSGSITGIREQYIP